MNPQLRSFLQNDLDALLDQPFDPQTPHVLDLIFCYRVLLQRNPERLDIDWLKSLIAGHTTASLVQAIIGSHEYQSLRQFQQIPGEPVEVATMLSSGFSYHFYLQDRDVGVAIARGVYEPDLMTAIEQAVTPGSICIDAGANSGIFSLIMARKAGPDGRVYAFEPFPRAFHLLRRNTHANHLEDSIFAFPMALGDRAGTVKMYFPAGAELNNFGTMFIPKDPDLPITRNQVFDTVPVEQVRADDILPTGDKVSVIKMDVEGAEVAALDGMRRIMKKGRPTVFVEFNPGCLLAQGAVQPKVLLERFWSAGYQIIELETYIGGGRTPFRYDLESRIPLYNLVCIPK
jgi:FkbM family methyltransferase